MEQQFKETLSLAKRLRENLVEVGLPPSFAKLYSQQTRLNTGQNGLTAWRRNESSERLNDAIRLIEVAFAEREAGISNWYNGMKRAGELLEWLSHPSLNPKTLPLRLLAAATYQLAGFPARAASFLKERNIDETESKILYDLLKADFPSLLKNITKYWSAIIESDEAEFGLAKWHSENLRTHQLSKWLAKETISCLGVITSSMRWGNDERLPKALEKLSSIEKMFLYGGDSYSWLLAKLCSEVASVYIENSMRNNIYDEILEGVSKSGLRAIERYLRHGYKALSSIAWPSQIQGIKRLSNKSSFTLCTPTGSGKTTIAELAILQSLFIENNNEGDQLLHEPLVMYLVPTRALAAEVESKLSRVLKNLTTEPIVVTGLYGGTDWGPTDAWLTSLDRTVLICTYEKAEALIKFLGPLFLFRVSLIVIDEAHLIEYDGNEESLRSAENRALRLESIGTRLLTYIENFQSRVIALSAVAYGVEDILASWILGQVGVTSVKSSYRSTRQLVGRLMCQPGRRFEIRYDMLDGASLQFENEGQSDGPYIPNPFPPHPPAITLESDGPEKRLRPYLFWAAMHLAAPDEKGHQRSVLVSITQGVGGYAEDFLNLLDSIWAQEKLPNFFQEPTDSHKLEVWEKCLQSCEDYFGKKSREYRLLKKGIILHHGKMPGLLARLLIEVIQEKIAFLVFATSTLSEGVNLPFEIVLIPSLRRSREQLNVREFSNLIGRAGRPGYGTEGISLVLLDGGKRDWSIEQAHNRYLMLINQLQKQNLANAEDEEIKKYANSPLAELIVSLAKQWSNITGSKSKEEFFKWLEQTAPLAEKSNIVDSAIETLDSLDNILLSAVVEIEQIANKDLSLDELEDSLKKIWQRSYAYYAAVQQEKLEEVFIRRGRSLKEKIYPDAQQRRRLYRTSLPPRHGNELLKLYPTLTEQLKSAEDYAIWSSEERFKFILRVVEQITLLPKFVISGKLGKGVSWNEVLHWWLDPLNCPKSPNEKQISNWYDYISKNFVYRFNWGLGSIISLAIDDAHQGELYETSLDDWPKTGLPWVVFWLKELITWGTLEPVAAYLLAHKIEVTRKAAENTAKIYYNEKLRLFTPNEILNASLIRDWVSRFKNSFDFSGETGPDNDLKVKLLRDFTGQYTREWRVLPVEVGEEIYWFDLAGFALANCKKPKKWKSEYLNNYDFYLDSQKRVVMSKIYALP